MQPWRKNNKNYTTNSRKYLDRCRLQADADRADAAAHIEWD